MVGLVRQVLKENVVLMDIQAFRELKVLLVYQAYQVR